METSRTCTLVPQKHRLGDRQTCCVNYTFGHQNPANWTVSFPDIRTINHAFCSSYVRKLPPRCEPSPPPYPPGVWFCTSSGAKPPHREHRTTGDVGLDRYTKEKCFKGTDKTRVASPCSNSARHMPFPGIAVRHLTPRAQTPSAKTHSPARSPSNSRSARLRRRARPSC
jgi:hypothetical protein